MIGLIVNPVSGLGGPAGLKGSDGADIQAIARDRGASPRAESRAIRSLEEVARSMPDAVVLTVAGAMGEDAVLASGLDARVVARPASIRTTADDTKAAASLLVAAGATLLLFAGGDGTARDICSAVLLDVPTLGIPTGVKMYSGCFAVSPVAAGEIATRWLTASRSLPLQRREVLDVAEDEVRRGRVDPTLFGFLDVPYLAGRTQARKASSAGSESDAVRGAAHGLARLLEPDTAYLLGPGSTTAAVASVLGVEKTSLGVDVILNRKRIIADATERQLLELVTRRRARAVVTVIGGQGFLLGRGNQQISAPVLREIGDEPLLVVATEDKLIALRGRPLLVDTGDPALDASLTGYISVVTGDGTSSFYRVIGADAAPEFTESSSKEKS